MFQLATDGRSPVAPVTPCPPQCVALLSFGCDVTQDCCEPNVCQRNVASETIGSCQTVRVGKEGGRLQVGVCVPHGSFAR